MAETNYAAHTGGTGDRKTGSPTITISSGVATLSVAQTGDVGAGFNITFNTTQEIYIKSMTSSTVFVVTNANGSTPSDEATPLAVNSISPDYSSLTALEAGFTDAAHTNNTDISATGASILVNGWCYSDGSTKDTSATTINGFTDDSSFYFSVLTPQGGTESVNNHRFTATVIDSTKYLRAGIFNQKPFTRIEGLQIDDSTGNAGITLTTSSTGNYISHNIIAKNSAGRGIFALAAGTIRVWNNIVYDCTDRIMLVSHASLTAYVYNNTFYTGTSVGFKVDSGTVIAKNNLVGNVIATLAYNGSWDASSDYNMSDDTSNTGGSNDQTSQTYTFINAAGDNFGLASGDTGAKDLGTDLSADANLAYSDDILGNPRTGTWDAGAHEEGAGSSSSSSSSSTSSSSSSSSLSSSSSSLSSSSSSLSSSSSSSSSSVSSSSSFSSISSSSSSSSSSLSSSSSTSSSSSSSSLSSSSSSSSSISSSSSSSSLSSSSSSSSSSSLSSSSSISSSSSSSSSSLSSSSSTSSSSSSSSTSSSSTSFSSSSSSFSSSSSSSSLLLGEIIDLTMYVEQTRTFDANIEQLLSFTLER